MQAYEIRSIGSVKDLNIWGHNTHKCMRKSVLNKSTEIIITRSLWVFTYTNLSFILTVAMLDDCMAVCMLKAMLVKE